MIDTGDQTKFENQTARIARINPWIWLALLWLTGIALGYSGFSIYAALNGENWSRLDIVYRLLQLIALESGSIPRPIPWQLDVARFGLPLMAAWTAVRAVMTLFRDQVTFLSLRFRKNHVVICGLGQKGFLFACDFLNARWKVVVIEQNQDHPLIDKIRRMGAVVLTEDGTDPQTLLRAGIRRAKGLIAVTGNDRSNAEVAVQVARVLDGRSTPLHCLIHIVGLDLWDLLHEWQLSMVPSSALRIELFNIYQRGAELLLARHPVVGRTAESARAAKYLVIGLGQLGCNLIVTCAERWFRRRTDPQERIRLIAVDRHASCTIAALAARFPQMEQSLSIQSEDIELESADFLSGAYLNLQHDPSPFETVFVCLDDDVRSIPSALNVRRQLRGMETEVILRAKTQAGLAQLALQASGASTTFPHLSAFMLVEETCTRDIFRLGTHERLAQALHESYLRSRPQDETNDPACRPWDELPERLREANRRQADDMVHLLHEAGFSLSVLRDWGDSAIELNAAEIEDLACLEHQRWCEEKFRQGWRFDAGRKDEQMKTHPDLVDWDRLPEAEREKNRRAVNAFPQLLHTAGYRIDRARPD